MSIINGNLLMSMGRVCNQVMALNNNVAPHGISCDWVRTKKNQRESHTT